MTALDASIVNISLSSIAMTFQLADKRRRRGALDL